LDELVRERHPSRTGCRAERGQNELPR
jgi:hypothetical protein